MIALSPREWAAAVRDTRILRSTRLMFEPLFVLLADAEFVETTHPEIDAAGKPYVYPYSRVWQSVAVPNHARSTINPLRSYPARDFAATPGSTIMPSISVSAAMT
jgi:hypothetical protein